MTNGGRTSYCPRGTSCLSALSVTSTFFSSPPRKIFSGTTSPMNLAWRMATIASRCPRKTTLPSLASFTPSTSSTTSPGSRIPSALLPCSTCVTITPVCASSRIFKNFRRLGELRSCRCTPRLGSCGGSFDAGRFEFDAVRLPSRTPFRNRSMTGAGTMCPWFSTLDPA